MHCNTAVDCYRQWWRSIMIVISRSKSVLTVLLTQLVTPIWCRFIVCNFVLVSDDNIQLIKFWHRLFFLHHWAAFHSSARINWKQISLDGMFYTGRLKKWCRFGNGCLRFGPMCGPITLVQSGCVWLGPHVTLHSRYFTIWPRFGTGYLRFGPIW